MIHQFDHRWATYDGLDARDVTDDEKADPAFSALPRYWVAESEVQERLSGRWDRNWLLGWRDIARATDARTTIATIDGQDASPEGGTLLMLANGGAAAAASLEAALNSFAFDFPARQKVGGTHLKYFTMRQLPAPAPARFTDQCPWEHDSTIATWMAKRTLELNYSAWDMRPYAQDLADTGAPFRWDPERRFLLRCELDAAFFHLYGIARDDVDYILDTFPIVKRKDEAAYGEYRTKRVILEIFDAMQTAVDTGQPYQTILDPPPGHGTRHPAREEASI